jgi:uncharacterized 2Fe-2S/4Fe-4S cluster protein (DUF4445 family)
MTAPASFELHFNHHRILVQPGSTLFEAAESLGIRVPTSCDKQGKCKECVVEVSEGAENLSARAEAERYLNGNYRLACCCRVVAKKGVARCHTMRRGEMRIAKAGQGLGLPWLEEAKSGDGLGPAVTRKGDRIFLDGKEIAHDSGSVHGLAMDLGTTTVVLRLLNLETGAVVATSCFENPQRIGGSDVMARIRYDCEDGTRVLQRTLVSYLNREIAQFPVPPASIYELVVAGNSTMRDLFFGLDVYSLGQSPYQSLTELEMAQGRRSTTSLMDSASHLGLELHPKARVYGLPLISGHVGSDAAASLLAVGMPSEDRLVAVMDLGTNTELLVGNKTRIMAASCPAGPAFEGGRIGCGMPGLPGAIERVHIDSDGSIRVEVIGGGAAEGVCGSGLVDALGELLRTGRMNALGRLQHGKAKVVLSAGGDEPVYLSEHDLNELAQAKGANAAGLSILFEEYGIRMEAVEVFYLAGGFGQFLDIQSAKRVGLLPNLPDSRIRQVGNASIEGASQVLLSQTRRYELERFVQNVTHCRLEAHPRFFDYFAEGCQFAPFEGSI